jgi:integrase
MTVVHTHRILFRALRMAVKWRLVARNAAADVDVPKPAKVHVAPPDEAQTATLLTAAEGRSIYAPLVVAVATGLRRGELLALRWADVDLERGRLAGARSVEQTKAGGLRFKSPKSGKGRVVALPSLAVEALRKHRAEQAKVKLALGPAYKDEGLVFARPDGHALSPKAFTWRFADFASGIGLGHVRLHDLRHAHASHLLRQRVPLKVVSDRLGHANIAITADLYSHVLDGMDAEAAGQVDAALRAAGVAIPKEPAS